MNKINGCAFLCDATGKIEKFLRDDFDFSNRTSEGRLFTSFIEKHSMKMALNLIEEIKSKNVAFDYRLDVNHKNKLLSLYFLGINFNNQLLIIGAENHKEAVQFTNHLQTISNEQANTIRSLLKEKSQLLVTKDKETEELFEQLTAVNNDLINLQRKLNKQNNELERLNDIKNKFMGIASHDLRNPLNVVQIYSEFLMDEGDNLNEDQKKFVRIINDSSRFMIGLVNDLLEFSKIESGKIQLTLQTFDIVKTISGIVDLLQPIAQNKDIIIIFRPEIHELPVEADLFKIEQVINNLVGNAIKFSYKNTTINISLKKDANHATVSVKNVGDGIKPEDAQKLFKPFVKIAARGTGNEAGSGLGLFIVKQVIDNHKGKIWFESEPKQETTFFVSLPLNNKNE